MKTNLIIFMLFILPFSMNAQTEKDTIFLQKKPGNTIFIDPDKETNQYKYILDIFNAINNKTTENWVPIYLLNDKYYLYKSCDCFNPLISITKRKTYFNCFELLTYKNINIKKVDNNTILICYKNFDKKKEYIKIKYIDKKAEVAVFEFINSKKTSSYLLMTKKENIKNFPIIINNCVSERSKEFKFDEINFKDLLK